MKIYKNLRDLLLTFEYHWTWDNSSPMDYNDNTRIFNLTDYKDIQIEDTIIFYPVTGEDFLADPDIEFYKPIFSGEKVIYIYYKGELVGGIETDSIKDFEYEDPIWLIVKRVDETKWETITPKPFSSFIEAWGYAERMYTGEDTNSLEIALKHSEPLSSSLLESL